jgi:hypothetical protein
MFSTLGNGGFVIPTSKVQMTTKTKELNISLVVIKGEMCKTQ